MILLKSPREFPQGGTGKGTLVDALSRANEAKSPEKSRRLEFTGQKTEDSSTERESWKSTENSFIQ